MEIQDQIEFYRDGNIFKTVKSSMRLQPGDFIGILGQAYKVTKASYALDYSNMETSRMSLNVVIQVHE